MLKSNFKWMAIGAAISLSVLLIYNHLPGITQLSAGKTYRDSQKINPEFANYISGFTSGYISTGSVVRIKLSSQLLESVPLHIPVEEKYFRFSPAIEGETVWTDAQTLEFRPKNRLPRGQAYEAKFLLSQLVDVKAELREFAFSFKTIEQSMEVEINSLQTLSPENDEYFKTSGIIYTADYAEPQTVEKALKADLSSSSLKLRWVHDEKNTTHQFFIDSIKRSSSSSKSLHFNWNGSELGLKTKGQKKMSVPGRDVFELMDTRVVNSDEQYVLLSFSNNLSERNSFEGAISLKGVNNLNFFREKNQLRIYPAESISGSRKLNVASFIRDNAGNGLSKGHEIVLQFDEVKPAVRLVGKGVILPSGNNQSLYFETVNLKAVDVKVTQIFENNVLQFLQENQLDGSYEIVRTGKKVAEKTINLGITNPADFKRYKRFALDLSDLFKTEKGALYRVSISFRKNYSAYACSGASSSADLELQELKAERNTRQSYDYYYSDEYYYSYDDDDYNWSQRNNPCNSAYYRSYTTTVHRNLLASDLGITAKEGNNGELLIAATNLMTAKPEAGTMIEFYTYQKQLIQSSTTDAQGLLMIKPSESPYFLVAKKGEDRAYVKLEEGQTLNLSMFETDGESIRQGIKGYIYCERGVWRPGDTLFLHVILEDKFASLPANHPVVFELYNPMGQLYKRILKSKDENGFYPFPIPTEMSIPTGNWTGVCKIGAVEFSKNLRIETVMPNRLKINLNAGNNELIAHGEVAQLDLQVQWLTGVTAKNLKATVDMNLRPQKTEFKKFANYQFDDKTRYFDYESVSLFEGKLNEQGKAKVSLDSKQKLLAPGMLKASFTTRVHEPGGGFSVDRFSVNYSPYLHYVGIEEAKDKRQPIYYTGKNHTINIATLNYKGQPASRQNIRIQVFKLNWRWWWSQYEDDLAYYSSSQYNQAVFNDVISTQNGKGSFPILIDDDNWGRYLIKATDEESGHSSTSVVYFDWANWMDRKGEDNRIVASLLHFKTNKESYQTNEEAVVQLPTPKGGRALVTIENGTKVLEAYWLETEKGTTPFKFKVKPEMAPNVYVHVSLIQPHSQTTNDLPIRLYGVVPVKVDDPLTHLNPLISMPDVLAPETKFNVQVAEQNGKEMTYTLAIVDEGLLDLTRFKTPDPWSHFYAREALGVKTWDVYDYVIGAYGGELERILAIGGDGTELNKDAAKANRFKPMVKVIGPFHLGKNEKRVHQLTMPMYIGSVRTMLIAGNKGAYGAADKTTPVKSPVMILGTLPRVLSINEEVMMPVSVMGGEQNLSDVEVKVSANEFIEWIGPVSKKINIKKNEEKTLWFKLKVKPQTGIAEVRITAQAGDKKSNYTMELDVRNPNPYQSRHTDYTLEAGKELKMDVKSFGMKGTQTARLEVSSIPALGLESRLNYLIDYPNGCIEQITSSAFAQLMVNDVVELSAQKKTQVSNHIKHALNKLNSFQMGSGALSYWPGGNYSSEWGTIYATHFIVSAEQKGYATPAGLKQNLLRYLQESANNWEKSTVAKESFADLLQSYRLYTLALAGKNPLSAMNRLRESSRLGPQATWRLAAAYALSGNNDEANKLINQIPADVPSYSNDALTYGSPERDMGMILETLCLMGKQSQAFNLYKKMATTFSSNAYLNTQATAYGLIGASAFIKKFGSSSSLQVEIDIDGKVQKTTGNKSMFVFNLSPDGNFVLKNRGKGSIYARVIQRAKPLNGEEKDESNVLVSDIRFRTAKGESVNPAQLAQGTSFIMDVWVKNSGASGVLDNLVFNNYVPSGWEIQNNRMFDDDEAINNFTYQDIRDDRIFTYFNLKPNETKKFSFNLIATYSGKFYLPGINVESMYEGTVYTRKKGSFVVVNHVE
jgi:alpha-2-macroglobulin